MGIIGLLVLLLACQGAAGSYTPLHLAVLAHDADAVARLARDPALLNARGGEDDATALMLAAEEGHLALVEALLQRGAEVNATVRDAADGDLDGATALMWASENGFPEVAAALLGAGAHVNARTRSGLTALMWACEDGHEAVVALLCSRGADVRAARWEDGHTALHEAARLGHAGIAWTLLHAGADVNATRSDNGYTPLHSAAAAGHDTLALQLVRGAGAAVDARARGGSGSGSSAGAGAHTPVTPLTLAIASRRLQVVRALLEEGASTACLGLFGPCPLDLAGSDNALRQLLLLYGAGAERSWVTPALGTLAALLLPFAFVALLRQEPAVQAQKR